jgi:two-component system cell cycle sensor histidine kinase/response regulator CckA
MSVKQPSLFAKTGFRLRMAVILWLGMTAASLFDIVFDQKLDAQAQGQSALAHAVGVAGALSTLPLAQDEDFSRFAKDLPALKSIEKLPGSEKPTAQLVIAGEEIIVVRSSAQGWLRFRYDFKTLSNQIEYFLTHTLFSGFLLAIALTVLYFSFNGMVRRLEKTAAFAAMLDWRYGDVMEVTEVPKEIRNLQLALNKTSLTLAKNAAELEKSEERYRELFSIASDWIWETDAQHSFVAVGKGSLANTVTGKKRWEIALPDGDLDKWDRHRADLEARRPFRNFIYQLKDDDGQDQWVLVNGKPHFAADGTFIGYRGSARVITQEYNARQAMDRLRLQLSEAVEVISDGFVLFDVEGRLVVCNQTYRKAYPLIDDLLKPGVSFADILRAAAQRGHFVEEPGELEGWIRERLSRHLSHSGVVETQLHDGRWYRITEQPTPSGGVVKLITDITELKWHADRLTDSILRLTATMEAMPDALLTAEEDGRIESFNAAAERLFGMKFEIVIKANLSDLLAEEKRQEFKLLMASVLAGEPSQTQEWPCLRKDGVLFPAEINVTALQQGDRRLFIAIIRDISGRKLIEEELRQAQKMDAIGRLASGLAHEFNNVLTAIGGFVDMANRRLENQERVQLCLSEIAKAGDRAANLTSQMLSFSRAQPTAAKVVRIEHIVHDTENFLTPLLGETVRLDTEFADFELMVKADPAQLTQAIVNLAINARDAMPNGGVVTLGSRREEMSEAKAKAKGLAPGSYAAIRVADNGHGMSKETLSRIFEPFFTSKAPGKGTGLGLSMVYSVAKQCGGTVEVESAPGRGSLFTILLPLTDKPPPGEEAFDLSDLPSGNETILLAEDDQAVRSMLTITLEELGYRVYAVEDGNRALAVFDDEGGVDLLIADQVMPGLRGPELVNELRLSQADLPAIIMSGYEWDGDISETDASTVLLRKPLDIRAMMSTIRALLDRH